MFEITRFARTSIALAIAICCALLPAVRAASAPQQAARNVGSASGSTAQPAAVCQPQWQPTFGGATGVNDAIRAMAVFDDGSGPELYVAGYFTMAGSLTVNHIAKWNGSRWSPVGGVTDALNSVVNALTTFDDGTGLALYAAGNFSMAGSVPVRGIAKWNGSSWSPLGGGAFGAYAMAVFDDGSGPALFVGGYFATAGGVAANNIAKWDGASWSALGSGVSFTPTYGSVGALAVFDDGSGPALFVGGVFITAGGVAASHIAKWNGVQWSPLASGTLGATAALTVFDDGSGPALYAGGGFTIPGVAGASCIAKWDGASWSALGSGIANGAASSASPYVDTLIAFNDGSGPALYAGGTFTKAGGATAHDAAKWNGSTWSPLGNGMSSTENVRSLAVFDDGSGPVLYAGGSFTRAGDVGASRISRWDGSQWSFHAKGLDAGIQALTTFDDGSGPALYAGGDFTIASGVTTNRVAKWNGSAWSPLGSGVNLFQTPATFVSALTSFDDGSGPALYAGGNFGLAGGIVVNNIARWKGSSWSSLGGGTSFGADVFTLAVFDDGSGAALYAGGNFLHMGGAAASRVAKWNGSSWSPLGSGLNGDVHALTTYDDGSGPALIAAGSFYIAGGVSARNIAKWNGSTWSPLGLGTEGDVDALAVFDDGSGSALYAGGKFTAAGGIASNRIARWNGTNWHPLNSGVNEDGVRSLAVFDSGSGPALYAGGVFTSADGLTTNHIAKWDGSWSSLSSGTDGNVAAMAVFDDGHGPALVVGGSFQTSPAGDSFLARWGDPIGCGAPGISICEPSVGGVIACPCGNAPAGGGLGCNNSSSTGGASLSATGIARLTFDTVVFTTNGEKPTATSIVLQGDNVSANGVVLGQGVRCVTGNLKRMYVRTASGGSISAPRTSDLHVHARSAAVGDVIAPGSHRYYGVYYRDPSVLGACPVTSTFNTTQQLDVLWSP